ncbi:MAG: DNA repair protein RecO [bacterium]|nr:DNA repair protein RecO [bacterium]
MLRSQKIEAFVLKKYSLLNKDIVITVFSREFGKLGIFAKGVKKINSRRLPHLQTGNLINVIISQKNSYSYLHETTLISGFSKIKEDGSKMQFAYYMLFVIERLLPENQKEDKLYTVLKQFFIDLSKDDEWTVKKFVHYLNLVLRLQGFINEDKFLTELNTTIEEIIHEKIPSFAI